MERPENLQAFAGSIRGFRLTAPDSGRVVRARIQSPSRPPYGRIRSRVPRAAAPSQGAAGLTDQQWSLRRRRRKAVTCRRNADCHDGIPQTCTGFRATSVGGPNAASPTSMKSPRVVAVLLLLAAVVCSPAVADAHSTRSDAMRIAVTVDPICTVAVSAGQWSIGNAVSVVCRNLRLYQPAPAVTGIGANGAIAHDVEPGDTVVINF
jgi:hypothetical protein